MAEREADLERSLAKGNARADELEGLINSSKDLVGETLEFAQTEGKYRTFRHTVVFVEIE